MSLTSLDVIYILFIICLKLTSFEHQTNAVKKELDIEQYGSFFNVGRVKLYKTPGSLQNQIHKSKVEILGEVLKHRVELLRKGATNKEVELVFLVDSSASVGAENFFNEVKFVKKLLADFTVSYNSTRVALVTFSSKSRVVRQIDHLTNASGRNHKCRLLDEELPKINYIGGGTYTMGALLEARVSNEFILIAKLF